MTIRMGAAMQARRDAEAGEPAEAAEPARGLSGPADTYLTELDRLDRAVYAAVAATPTPRLDAAMRRVSSAANYSRLSLASAAVLSLLGGKRGRQAAACGLVSVLATSAVVNLLVKPVGGRRRPDRGAEGVPSARRVEMPASRSFPSGHAAAAIAFASGASDVLPLASIPLHTLAAVVAYSRVHTGVHYPGDVIAGALLGSAIAELTGGELARRFAAASD